MLGDFLHKGINLFLFLFHQIIERKFHPHKHSVYITSDLLDSHVLFSVQEIVLCREFLPKLLAPLRQNSQNSWIFDAKMTTLYLIVSKNRGILGNFTIYSITCILLDSICIFLLTNFAFKWKGFMLLHSHFFDSSPIHFSVLLQSSTLHPTLIINILEQIRHCVVKFFIRGISTTLLFFFVDFRHDPVQKLHD